MSRTRQDEPIDLCCLDLAGTTVSDGGVVEGAFVDALSTVGITAESDEWPSITTYVTATMGTAKIDVFRALLRDEARAEAANKAFEAAYATRIVAGEVTALPGAERAIGQLRERGLKVAFITGFSPPTRDAVLEHLNWHRFADAALSPADVGRGRPAPDLVLGAIVTVEANGVGSTAVCGDTASDMICGKRAGAAVVAGVLTGSGTRNDLAGAGATHVLASIVELPPIVTPG